MPRKSWWARLPFGIRMTAGAAAMFVVVGGSAAGVATVFGPGPESTTAAAETAVDDDLGAPTLEEDPEVVSRAAAAAQPLPRRKGETPPVPTPTVVPTPAAKAPARVATTTDQLSRARVADDRADRTGPRPTRTTASQSRGTARREPVAPRQPVVTTRTDVETRAVPYDTEVVRDSSMPRGTRRVEVDGEAGEETLRYLVTLTDGRPTARRLLSTSVTKEPRNRVVAVGSRRHIAVDPHCEGPLHLCLPWGRSAVCPPKDARDDQEKAKEDVELLGPDGLVVVRQEPTTPC